MSIWIARENKYRMKIWDIYWLLHQFLYYLILMKTELFVLLAILALQASAIPFKQQISLLNSL